MCPILEADQDPALFAKVSHCDMCGTKLKSSCVREVRVEIHISEEGGGGQAPDIVLGNPNTGQSMIFCSTSCARDAAKIVASEVQNPFRCEDGTYTFPGHVMFRGKVEKWDIHYTRVGPASYDSDAQVTKGGF